MPLDLFLRNKVDLLDGVSWSSAASDLDHQRRLQEWARDPREWVAPPVAVEDIEIGGPHGSIPLRVYTPGANSDLLVMWLHGGAFSGGDLDMPESHVVSAELAHRTGAVVVAVDYRLAGEENVYPVPIDDAWAAWRWARTELRPGARQAVLGGASAGGALAVSTALREIGGSTAPDRLLLAYPFLHFPVPALDDRTGAEMAALPHLLRFTASGIAEMVRVYVGRISGLPSDALPGSANLAGLPETLVVVNEYDDLRPSAELFVTQLSELSIPVRVTLAYGMPHGHLNRTPSLREVDRTLDEMSRFVSGADTQVEGILGATFEEEGKMSPA